MMCCLLPSSGILVSLLIILNYIPKTNAQGISLWDHCTNQTDKGGHLCGNKCLTRDQFCYCGDTILRYEYIPTQHCCGECQTTPEGGKCPQGEVRDITKPCPDGKCYADYDHSYNYVGLARQNFLSYDKTYFSCPQREECLAIINMCQGHSACGDHQLCDEDLRCDIDKGQGIKSLNQSEVINKHFYCQYQRKDGNSVYDTINREDENITNTLNPKAVVNYSSYLTKCTAEEGGGLTCYFDENTPICYHVASWCRSDRTLSCVIDKNGNKISSYDKKLCQDKLFWNNVTWTERGIVSGEHFMKYGEGVRCNGSLMQMIYPWYKWFDGMPDVRLKQQCEDKSDQVFNLETPCPDLNHYLSIQNQIWCSENISKDEEICTNPKSWIEKNGIKISDDPHNCQASCNETGPNCISCRNESYFSCYQSGQCIHPDLKCDGHPQCLGGEDEEYEMCKGNYLTKHIVEPFATFKCNSTVYPIIYTIATACNDIHECLDDADESLCDLDKYTTPVLVFLAIGILIVFMSLKLPQLLDFHNKRQLQKKNKMYKESYFHDIIQKLKENPEDKSASREINIFLLHILHKKKRAIIEETFVKFYDNMEDIFQMEEAQIFRYLKANIHSLVTADVIEYKFRGLKTRITEFVEETSGNRIINGFRDKITETPSLRMSLSTLRAIYSIISNFLNVAKDYALCSSLLLIMGGPYAIKDYPTNFSSGIVLCWMVTIILRVGASSLYLALNAPFLVFTSARLKSMRGGKVLARLGCLCLFPLNTVLLQTNLEMAQHRATEAARDKSDNTLELFTEYQEIGSCLNEYLQIQLG